MSGDEPVDKATPPFTWRPTSPSGSPGFPRPDPPDDGPVESPDNGEHDGGHWRDGFPSETSLEVPGDADDERGKDRDPPL